MRLAVVVPTRNRPDQLVRLIKFLEEQTLRPDHVVVVDGSDPSLRSEVGGALTTSETVLPWSMVLTERPSTSGQRNLGIAALRERSPFDFVAFLDDDVEPEPTYLAELIKVYESDHGTKIGGVSGVSQLDSRSKSMTRGILSRMFLLGGGRPGSVLSSGVNLPVSEDLTEPQQVEWLFGCSAWRSEIFEDFSFSELNRGYVLFDDVEFSVRVGKKWKLIVNPAARLFHAHERARDERQVEDLAYKFIVNRYFVVRHCLKRPFGILAFWWSTLGVILLWSVKVFGKSSRNARIQLRGFVRGVMHVLTRKVAYP